MQDMPQIQYEKIDVGGENPQSASLTAPLLKGLNAIEAIKDEIKKNKILYYYINKPYICVFSEKDNKSYCIENILEFKDIFEDESILKCGYKQKEDYILLKQLGIDGKNLMFDTQIAGYILNSNINKYGVEYLANEYLNFDIDKYISDIVGVPRWSSAKCTIKFI